MQFTFCIRLIMNCSSMCAKIVDSGHFESGVMLGSYVQPPTFRGEK